VSKPIKVKEFLEKLLQLGGQTGDPGQTLAFCYGEALAGADREVVEIIAEMFLKTWPNDLQAMRTALAGNDLASLARTAHSLKGTLATFAAEPATRVAADLETRAGHGRNDGLAHELDSLEREISLLTPYLQAVVDEVSG